MAAAPYPIAFHEIAGAPQAGTLLCHRSDLMNNACVELNYRLEDKLFNGFICERNGLVRAYENSCPHTGSPLNIIKGQFFSNDGIDLQCRTHDAHFNPKNGHCTKGPCQDSWLRQILIVVDGDKILAG